VSALERMIMWMSPKWGQSRARARLMARHFESAMTGRRTSGWSRFGTDANAAAAGVTLAYLRAQARDLVRNNPWARRGLKRLVTNTIGWGIRPKATGHGSERVMDLWRRWAETTQCDAAGRLTFYGLQALVMRTVAESGEILVRRRRRRPEDGLAVPLQYQLLEPDFIDSGKDGVQGFEGGSIIQGVEFDAIGRRVAYWLFDQHPGGTGQLISPLSKRVPAEGILHVFDQERAGQVRGPSWFASVDLRLHDLDEFEDATLMKQKIAACMAAFVTDLEGTGTPLGEEGTDLTTGQLTDTFEPGMIMNLPQGKQVTVANPPQATDYQSYSATALRGIAAGLGPTYEDMTGDYCVAPETRILRADLRWVRAEQLMVGDPIVAFDEEPPGGQGHRRKWRKAAVVRVGSRQLNRRRVATDNGMVVVSDEHLFLCTGPSRGARRGQGMQARSESPQYPGAGQRWVRADMLRPGDRIVFLCAPWAESRSYLHGYLKGMADGEGYLDQRNAGIGIAQNPGAVFDECGVALAELGFRATARDANGGHKCQQWKLMGIGESLRFLGEVRPTRLLQYADSIYDGRMMSGGAKKSGWPTFVTVQTVDELGVGPVITLETSTRTIITEGLCSHNSQVNFSSARMGRIAHMGDVHHWRENMIIPQFCQPAWAWMIDAMLLAGEEVEEAPAEWTPPATPMIDPDKEGLALMRMVRSGAMTPDQMVREQGYDPEQFWQEYAKSLQRIDRLGIVLDSDPRKTTGAGQAQAVEKKSASTNGSSKPNGPSNGAAQMAMTIPEEN
jgi:lambda family phage portal protein